MPKWSQEFINKKQREKKWEYFHYCLIFPSRELVRTIPFVLFENDEDKDVSTPRFFSSLQ